MCSTKSLKSEKYIEIDTSEKKKFLNENKLREKKGRTSLNTEHAHIKK